MRKNDSLRTPKEEEEPIKIQLEEDVDGEFDPNNPDKPIYHFPWTLIIVFGVIIVLMVACIIVIACNGGLK